MAKYLKPDSELGYIEDGVEIEFLKFNNMRHTLLGFMLGDFDENGNYVVSDEIKKELIEMPKHIVEVLESVEVCQSSLKLDKPITFMINYEGNKASLILIEKLSYEANFKLDSGTYSNINEFVLDEVETSGEINRNVLYQRWNVGDFGGEVIDIFSCGEDVLAKYFGIVARFKYLLEANSVLLSKENLLEEIEAEYANSVWKIIKHYPKLEESVLKQVKTSMNGKKEFFKLDKPNFCKTFNEVLVNAIESNINVLNEQEKKEFEVENRNALNVANIKRRNVLDYAKGEIQTRELSGLNVQEVAKIYINNVNDFKQAGKKQSNRETLIDNLKLIGVELAPKEADNLVVKVTEKTVEAKLEDKKVAKKEEKKVNKPVKKANSKKADSKKTQKSDDKKDKSKTDNKADTKKENKPSENKIDLIRKKRRRSTVVVNSLVSGKTQTNANSVVRASLTTMEKQFDEKVYPTNVVRDNKINERSSVDNGGLEV